MKIVQVHNYYQQSGGEDAVVKAERENLEGKGDVVISYYKSNDEIDLSNNKLAMIAQLIKVGLKTIWNQNTYREFRKLLQFEKPDIVHCHNTFPLISPAIYWACAKENVPVVQTLHNYRLLCLNAYLFKADEGVCERCVQKRFKWPGIKYGCYRNSKAGSVVVALMLFVHKLVGTWSKKVTAYIVLTKFQKQKMIEGGLPADKVWVKPNFMKAPEVPHGAESADHGKKCQENQKKAQKELLIIDNGELITGKKPYCLFVGRLSPEKGCDVLLHAWKLMEQGAEGLISDVRPPISDSNQPQLIIVGDGPEREKLEQLAMPHAPSSMPQNISFLGKLPKERVLSLMHNAEFLVLPSLCYEGFPMTIVEAFSCGTPVVASDDGGMSSIIEDRQNGLNFKMGDADALAGKLEWAFDHPEKMSEMGKTARQHFQEKYSEERSLEQLNRIYQNAGKVSS